MPVPVAMFPEVRHTSFLDKRLFNQESQRYVCVLQDNNNNSPGLLATKTLSTHADVDVDFRVHYFSSAKGKMVMLVHNASGTCLYTDEDNRLALRSLHDRSPASNILREADPEEITRADSRFFYIHSSGMGRDNYVIKSTNGEALSESLNNDKSNHDDYNILSYRVCFISGDNLYLSISDNGVDLTLKSYNGMTFPSKMSFNFRK
ncbi:hypothetical protein PR048_027025 [Dryococelus australis]|uniref:Uncharacterized protein n=1 Tax=Dryococelus australis TaxID=614101 RepID=A0ABQ9GN03_9NEOP|nr:hypothetical protein PR048_027025 [Dryococelus australis]